MSVLEEPWQVIQANKALSLYNSLYSRQENKVSSDLNNMTDVDLILLLRDELRLQDKSLQTERVY